MDEKRKFFRVKNMGEMHARFGDKILHIIDISACSAALISDVEIPQSGIIEFSVNLFTTELSYELIKKDEEKMIIVFPNEEDSTKLFPVLKNLARMQNRT